MLALSDRAEDTLRVTGAALLGLLLAAVGACHVERHAPTASAETVSAPLEGDRCLGFDNLADQVIYFVMPDRFYDDDPTNNQGVDVEAPGAYHGGDLRGLTAKLDYLADLGVTALWITPVVDQVDTPATGAGFEDWGYHGYWAEDFEHLEPHLGTEDDLRELLRAAHGRGIRVVLDVVVNHSGYRSHWSKDPAWTRSPDTGTCPDDDRATDLDRCLMGLPDFRTEDPRVRAALVGWQLKWVRRFAFDGFRFDTMKHVEPEVFVELHQEGSAIALERHGCTSFLAIGEWWGATGGDDTSARLVAIGAVDTLFDFSFDGEVEGFVSGRMRAEAMAHHLEQRHVRGALPMVISLDTHDVETMVHRLGGDRQRYALAAALLMTTHGIPLITWGDELAKPGGKWPHNRDQMPWESLDTDAGREMLALWRGLIDVRRRSAALRGTELKTVVATTNTETGDAQLAFLRGAGEGTVLVVMTRGAAADVVLDLDAAGAQRLFEHGSVGEIESVSLRSQPTRSLVKMGRDAIGIWRLRSPRMP